MGLGELNLNDIVTEYDDLIKFTKERIKKVYLQNNKPWIIGYSGGKDSTATMHIIIESLLELPRKTLKNHVYIISSDTLVETPLILNEISKTLNAIQEMADNFHLPLSTHRVAPKMNNTFWVNLIGRGYPSPNQNFRWCTDRMKIDPTNDFIKEVVDECGEVIVVLGIRNGESNSRDKVINAHNIEYSDLMKHTTLKNAYVFPAILEFTIDDVWNLLLNSESPWGADNTELFQLYRNSNENDECPLIIDKETKDQAGSCGNSRFGCWVCTVVKEDKSLTGFIKNGYTWLEPLLSFRNWLVSIRNNREYRMKIRLNGQIYFTPVKNEENNIIIDDKSIYRKILIKNDDFDVVDNDDNRWNIFESNELAINFIKENNIDLLNNIDPHILVYKNDTYYRLGVGGFTIQAREMILENLLRLQQNILESEHDLILIQEDEIKEIIQMWYEQGYWNNNIQQLYFEIFGRSLEFSKNEIEILDTGSEIILTDLCADLQVDINAIRKLLILEKDTFGLSRRIQIQKEIKKLLTQDYLNI